MRERQSGTSRISPRLRSRGCCIASRSVKRAHEIRFAHGSFVPTASLLFLFNRQPWHVYDARVSAILILVRERLSTCTCPPAGRNDGSDNCEGGASNLHCSTVSGRFMDVTSLNSHFPSLDHRDEIPVQTRMPRLSRCQRE